MLAACSRSYSVVQDILSHAWTAATEYELTCACNVIVHYRQSQVIINSGTEQIKSHDCHKAMRLEAKMVNNLPKKCHS